MSTTALVCVKKLDERIDGIPVNWDGYIDGGVGETLENYWNNPTDVLELCASTNGIRSLGNSMTDTEFFKNDNVGYIRSLKNMSEEKYLNKQEMYNFVYMYYLNENGETGYWTNFGRTGYVPLSQLLSENNTTFERMCKQIIGENKSSKEDKEDKLEDKKEVKPNKKQQIVDGKKDKPAIITEKDVDKPEEEQKTVQTITNLTDQEQQFLSKFLQFTYMNLANEKLYNKIIKDFKQVLGKENEQIIIDFIEKEKQSNQQQLEQVKTELTQLREQIKNEEQEKATETNRKLSIVSILDKNLINESVEVDLKNIAYDTGLPDTQVNKDIIDSVFGQMSDGIWENSSRMEGYWRYADMMCQDGKIFLVINNTCSDSKKYGSKFDTYNNPYIYMSQEQVINFFANKIKQIVYIEFGDSSGKHMWQRNDQTVLDYLTRSYNNPVTVADAYKAYDILKGRSRSDSEYIAQNDEESLSNEIK